MSAHSGGPAGGPLHIDAAAVLRLTEALIRIESHCDSSNRETAVGRFLTDWFGERGIQVERQIVIDERANVIARVPGGDGPSLMLNGHLDTVPAGAMESAFDPVVKDGRLHGRGSCDMKGAVAAMACVLSAIHESDVHLTGDLIFAGTIDEETGSLGVKHLVENGALADYALVGEPTRMQLGVAHKGVSFVRIALTGRAAHGSIPEQGVNACLHGARLALAIDEKLAPTLALRTHELLGRSTVNLGRLSGGTQPNIVAEGCELDVDRRTLPGEPNPVSELRALVESICTGVDDLSWTVKELPASAKVPHVPLETPADGVLARAVSGAAAEMGTKLEPRGLTYWTDGAALSAAGVETVVIGPGDVAYAHSPNESVPVAELAAAAQLYASVALSLLGPAASSSASM